MSVVFKRTQNLFKGLGIFGVLILLIVIAAMVSPQFLELNNIVNLLRQISIIGIIAIGMTFVILAKGIDLSVGSTVAVVAVICADLFSSGVPVFLVLLIGLLTGILVGSINGLGIAIGGIPPFVMTLGLMVAGRGVAMTYANGQPISIGEASQKISWLGHGTVGGIPVPVIVFLIVIIIGFIILKYTAFGRAVYAVGDNKEAARLSGINVNLIEFSTYAISGLCAAITALILLSRLTVGEPSAGVEYELEAIAMVVIGGTSLFGGIGSVIGTAVGASIIGIISNVLNLVGINPFTQQVIKGAIIILAVYIEARRTRSKE
ncbi:ABC transporter permease [Oceanobacillus sojae]|uniref:ABC transporter permease n=1 Tax=Oceanobacillus sojae TaxID=582851 RepID=UPI0009886EEA|nr:ABC transporter permease [Oceanobacillus sojae]